LACLSTGRAFMGGDGIWRPWVVEVCLCLLSILLSPSPVYTPWFLVCNRFFINLFQKNGFVGLKESTSLWVVILVGVRLPTAGSPQTPRKRDPHWELLLLSSYFLVSKLLYVLYVSNYYVIVYIFHLSIYSHVRKLEGIPVLTT